MSERQDYINICARAVYNGNFTREDVPGVVDDTFRTLNTAARAWYAALSDRQMTRFDGDVWKRVEYLRGLVLK